MTIDWSWGELVTAVIGVVMGWLAKVFHNGQGK